ncbi:helix-turn-helix domain-containing protein [Paenibacillus elgii]|uniref:helix-turn-helix domain-containing protein n=1 Tax=Paenibacillus elgii TaxID=189691 RepID=UPI000248D3A9|nr:helix-turn-helix transcriptional regulator [Paenibacillus elgii]
MSVNVGVRIKEIRISKGITSKFLSDKLGLHPSTLNKYESGDRNIKADILPQIADILGVDVRVFFN